MIWFAAMTAVLLFMLLQRTADGWPLHKLRTWLAMFVSSALGWAAVYTSDGIPLLAFTAIDIVACVIVLVKPAGAAQKAIGLFYVVMILWHMGMGIATFLGPVETSVYENVLVASGWAQFSILLVWSGWDVGRHILHRFGFRGASLDSEALAGASR